MGDVRVHRRHEDNVCWIRIFPEVAHAFRRAPIIGSTNEAYYATKIGDLGDAPDDALLMYHSSIPRQRDAAS